MQLPQAEARRNVEDARRDPFATRSRRAAAGDARGGRRIVVLRARAWLRCWRAASEPTAHPGTRWPLRDRATAGAPAWRLRGRRRTDTDTLTSSRHQRRCRASLFEVLTSSGAHRHANVSTGGARKWPSNEMARTGAADEPKPPPRRHHVQRQSLLPVCVKLLLKVQPGHVGRRRQGSSGRSPCAGSTRPLADARSGDSGTSRPRRPPATSRRSRRARAFEPLAGGCWERASPSCQRAAFAGDSAWRPSSSPPAPQPTPQRGADAARRRGARCRALDRERLYGFLRRTRRIG